MRLTKIQRAGLTLLAKPGATLIRVMNNRDPIRIVAGDEVLKVAQVTFRSWFNQSLIYKSYEEQRPHRVVTYKITEAGRKVMG